MNTQLSPVIFSQLMNGSIINQRVAESGELIPNEMYDEIFANSEHYKSVYASLGYELAMIGNSFFIRELGDVDHFRDVSMKVQVLIEVISRQITGIPLHASVLLDPRSGVSRETLHEIGDDDEVKDILKACDMKNSLDQEVDNVLVGRSIAYWSGRDHLVLTDGGVALFERMYS